MMKVLVLVQCVTPRLHKTAKIGQRDSNPISLSNFVQRAWQNWTDSKKSYWFWLLV